MGPNGGQDMNPHDDWAADARAGTLVIADGPADGAARMAVEAIGARLLGQVPWHAAGDRLDRQGAVAVVLAEAGGADAATLDRVLPRLDALAAGGDTRVIVALGHDQIDQVAAQLAGPGIALLCAPSVAERVGALALAAHEPAGTRAHDVAREAESVRLRRLNEEVAHIAETLARLTRGDAADSERGGPRPDAVGDRTLRYAAAPAMAVTTAPDIAARDIREAIRARRMRDQVFGAGLFEDPAWDMLLDLFAAELERAQVSVSSLCIAAAVAPTTALRWIARMTETGLFERQPDPFDRRRAFMALSDRASAGMREYVAATRRAGVAIA